VCSTAKGGLKLSKGNVEFPVLSVSRLDSRFLLEVWEFCGGDEYVFKLSVSSGDMFSESPAVQSIRRCVSRRYASIV